MTKATDLLQFINEAEKRLKTLKGSAVKRSKYGVGKLIGGTLYLHKNYVKGVVPKELLSATKQVLDAEFPHYQYNVIKWDIKTGAISFCNSLEFDTVEEPVAGEFVTVKPDGSTRKGYTKQIWHHKWLWVKDDYKGFDVDKSFKRSEIWLQIPDIEFSKIGNKTLWDSKYIPIINRMLKEK